MKLLLYCAKKLFITMESKNNLMLPISIVIAGVIISGTIFYGNRQANTTTPQNTASEQPAKKVLTGPKAINDNDHMLGDPNAPLTMILFDDLQCPYCQQFHTTTNQMMNDYGKSGKVRLIFRHAPLPTSMHPKAIPKAIATECVANLGGNDAFWKTVDYIFTTTTFNKQTGEDLFDLTSLSTFASKLKIDKTKFSACLTDEKIIAKVQEDIKDSFESGNDGTPFYVILNSKGDKFPISKYGALPWTNPTMPEYSLKAVLDRILNGQSPYEAIDKILEEYEARQGK